MYGDSLNKSHYEQKHDVTEKGQRKTSFGWVNKCISQEKQISGELSILFFNLRRNRGSGKLVEGGEELTLSAGVVRGNGKALENIRENIQPKTCHYIAV